MSEPTFRDAVASTWVEMIKGSGGGMFWPTVLLAIGYVSGWPEGYELGVFFVTFMIGTLIMFAAIIRAKVREQQGYR